MIDKEYENIVGSMSRVKEFRVFVSRLAMLCDSCASVHIFVYRSISV